MAQSPYGIGTPNGPPEGSGFTYGKGEMGDRFITANMLFPGSTASHTLINANKSQKAVMDNKYRGVGEDYNPYDNAQMGRYQDYDSRADVKQRRWEQMGWSSKLQNIDYQANSKLFWFWNGVMGLGLTRIITTSFRQAIKIYSMLGACGFMIFIGVNPDKLTNRLIDNRQMFKE